MPMLNAFLEKRSLKSRMHVVGEVHFTIKQGFFHR